MKNIMWQGVLSVLFPKRCIGCRTIIPHSQHFLCEVCKSSLPITGITLGTENLLYEKMNLTVDTQYTSAFLFFKKDNITQQLVHYLKYKNLPELGTWMAEIWYEQNKDNPNLKEIDTVIPVPIHSQRLKKRNYNQISLCAQTLARLMNCEYNETLLIRSHHLESQTQSGRYERLQRMEGAFKRTSDKSGHFLLVDDVFTTGATLISCSEELQKVKNTHTSIFTLAMVS